MKSVSERVGGLLVLAGILLVMASLPLAAEMSADFRNGKPAKSSRYEVNMKVGYDLAGDLKKSRTRVEVPGYPVSTYQTVVSPATTRSTAAGASVSMEGFGYPINDYIGLGLGLTYQIPRKCNGEFNFLPMYYAMKLRVPIKSFQPYIVGHIGYNLAFGDSEYHPDASYMSGGLYTAFGGGFAYKNWFIEVLATQNRSSITDSGYTSLLVDRTTNKYSYTYYQTQREVNYSKVTVNLGVRFF